MGSLELYYYEGDTGGFAHYVGTDTNFYTGKNLIVATFQYNSASEQIATFYKNGNQSDQITGDDIGSNVPGVQTEWRIAGSPEGSGSDTNSYGGFQVSKFYSAAVWDRVLTTDEINQLTIDKLVSKRQTLPFYQISDNTPIDGQNLVYSSSTGQYEPKTFAPTEYELQLCGGNKGTSEISPGWPRASTVYVSDSGANSAYPTKLFDNTIDDWPNGWHSVSDGGTASNTHPHVKWDDAQNQYVPLTTAENDAYLQIRFTQPRMITKVLMLWRDNYTVQFPMSFSIYGSNTQPSVLRSTTGMNLLFSTDGSGYSQPSLTTWSGSAQNNLNSAISFVIPAANQGKYEYLTFHFTEGWDPNQQHSVVITEMFFFHKVQNFRNYQYKQQEGLYVTEVASQGEFVELQGFHGSQAISITPLTSGSTIRIRFIIRGEFLWNNTTTDESFRLLWNVKKIVNGVSSTLNAPTIPGYPNVQQTLSNYEAGYPSNSAYINDADSTMDTYNICFFDTNGADQGQTITYMPQITIQDGFDSDNEFRLNSVGRLSNDVHRENTISTAELEEISTGPPLTVNNVAVSGTPSTNDVLQYNGSAWTNTAMHTRNYRV